MYLKNPYYLEVLQKENKKYKARIELNNMTLENENIKNIKYDLSINDNEKFSIGGVYGATITLTLLNYEGEFDNTKFENNEFSIKMCIAMDELYTVRKFSKSLVKEINSLKIKNISSLWVPQGRFYPTEITKNENKTITIKLIDKTKYLENEYICELTPPFSLKQLYDDVHKKFQITSDTVSFYNEDVLIEEVPQGYTGKQILGFIAECACGFYTINRIGNGEIRSFGLESVKSIPKGEYKKFLPSENYITIKKIKYADSIIGSDKGYILELDEKNPLITDTVVQSILLKMQGFTFIPYTFQAINSDFALDVGDKFDVTDTNNVKYLTYIMNNSWEFTGAISQNWQAKGENELNNNYYSKGPLNQQIEDIVKKQIPNMRDEAINKATELITNFNGGYVVKKDGELFISDNVDLDKAQHIWRWNINGLGYSSTGISGPYGLAMTMDGKIVADFITAGTMSAERINGGTLKLGGNNNQNGSVQVVDADGNILVTISKDGLVLENGTKLITNGGLLSNIQFKSWSRSTSGDSKSTGEYNYIGYLFNTYMGVDKYDIYIDYTVPEDFVITSAYITLRHLGFKIYTNEQQYYGNARSVKIYLADFSGEAYVNAEIDGEYSEDLSGITYEEVENAFDNETNTYNPTQITENNLKIEEVTTNDISSVLNKSSRIKIATTNSEEPNSTLEALQKGGFISAQLNIWGYLGGKDE